MTLSPKQRQLAGHTAPPATLEIERGQVRRYAAAIGETDAIHFDEAAAKALGYPSLVAPPTFISTLTPGTVFFDELGWDLVSVMHRSEEYEYFRPVFAGDVLVLNYAIANLYEQDAPSGGLVFLIVETRAADKKGRPVFKARRVLVKLKG